LPNAKLKLERTRMCLAIPGKVIEIEAGSQPKMGKVSFGGIQKRICLEWVPDVKAGEYVIVHVGFAISRMDEKEAMETLKLFEEIEASLDELQLPEPD
jgi:hydrogenase expression/formation protein HypC